MGICTPSNTCFLRPNRVHNPNGILTGSAGFVQSALECCRDMSFPSKLPCPMGEARPRSETWFLGSAQLSIPNDISIDSADVKQPLYFRVEGNFPQNCPLDGIIWTPSNIWSLPSAQPKWHVEWFTVYAQLAVERPRAVVPPQNCPSDGGRGPLCNILFLGLIRVLNPNSIGSAVFLQGSLLWQTDQQTGHDTQSATIGCICVITSCSSRQDHSIAVGGGDFSDMSAVYVW